MTGPAARLATFGAYQDADSVFALEDGSPIPPHRINMEFDRLTRKTGLPRMRFHDCRHTAASIALESSVDIKVVSDQLGHATTKITLDLYSHVVRRLHEEAAERVGRRVTCSGFVRQSCDWIFESQRTRRSDACRGH